MDPFVPARPPTTEDGPQQGLDWAEQELQQVNNTLDTVHDLDVLGNVPERLVDGMIRYADGVGWNPGYGPGPYCYVNGTWQPMFPIPDAVSQGGSTIFNLTSEAGSGSIGAAPANVNNYQARDGDDVISTSNPAAGWIRPNEPGYWLVGFGFTFDVEPTSANVTREVAARLVDLDGGGISQTLSYWAIPRYGEVVQLTYTTRMAISAVEAAYRFIVQVWSPTGHVMPIITIEGKELWMARVSNKNTYPGA